MKEIATAVTALLAFLIPLGIYCLLLAFINRRNKPLMVRGVWDALGLLGAISGFLLWTMPVLFEEFCSRVFDALEAPYVYAALWVGYFLFLAFSCTLTLFLRASKTMIYNVDTKVFNTLLEQAVARIGLSMQMNRGLLVLTPAKTETENNRPLTRLGSPLASNDRRFVELSVENFSSMCHVTLHWDQCEPHVRSQIEEELERGLELAAPEENAAAGWFYSVSGLIFGALFMLAAMILFLILFPKQ